MEYEDLERVKEVIAEGSTDEKLNLAEELLANDCPAQAQSVLDSVNERNAKWHFLQSKIFFEKNWIYESKKQMEFALELEPNNSQYIEELEKLNTLGETPPHSEKEEKPELDKGSCKQDCAEASCLGCMECCCSGVCGGICEGCN